MVDPGEYKWSSFSAQALGRDIKLWTPHAECQRLGTTKSAREIAYRRLFEEELSTVRVSEIKLSQQTGSVLGTDRFRQQFEDLTGFRQSYKKRGRKPHQDK